MAITSAVPTSFKVELLTATHDFTASTGDTFKLAFYTSSATLDATTTAYTTTNEVTGTGYTAGGATLTSSTPVTSGTTAICDFADVTFTAATITARGCMIYNSSKSNKCVLVEDFGSDYSSSGGNFVVTMPTADASNAILRLA
jgi:hypothetical protein